MKSKHLIQALVLLALLFSPLGSVQPARASSGVAEAVDALVITRDLSYWNATYIGFVNGGIFENWHFVFTESHDFTIAVSPVAGDLVPLLILMDGNGGEITRAVGALTSSQPAGNYSIQVQPESGSGFYILTLREEVQITPAVLTVVNPMSVNPGESAVVTVSLSNVPAEGYTSAEFTCTYNAKIAEVSNIATTNLFGADAAVAINGPQSGSFIVAIAGSNGNKATTSGTAFTFSVKGLEAGQTAIECRARVSKGDNVLIDLPSTASSLTVLGSTPTPTPVESLTPTTTSTAGPSPTPSSTFTPGPSPTPTLTFTPGPSPTPTSTFTPGPSPTGTLTTPTTTPTATFSPTPTALPVNGTLTGQVNASKPVTVSLFRADSSLAGSTIANNDGTFSLTALAGTYTVVASASGFLNAQGSAILTGGQTSTMSTVSLPAGDIDGNAVIDQFDAMTIGMSYNTALPAAADLNNDGVINVLDLELLAANYRKSGALAWQ